MNSMRRQHLRIRRTGRNRTSTGRRATTIRTLRTVEMNARPVDLPNAKMHRIRNPRSRTILHRTQEASTEEDMTRIISASVESESAAGPWYQVKS